MTTLSVPYFLKNKDWYKVRQFPELGYILTNKAPQKAIESYKAFYDYEKQSMLSEGEDAKHPKIIDLPK